jgi:hypothetical protein
MRKISRLVDKKISWFDVLMFSGRGSNTAVSASNTRKRIVIVKNRKEKEARNLCFVSNPHSNGDIFSRFAIFLIFNK